MSGVQPVPGMQSPNPDRVRGCGCAFIFTLLLTIFVIIPWMAIERAVHDTEEAVMSTQMGDNDVEFVVLYEDVQAGDARLQHLELGDVVSRSSDEQLRQVSERLPRPWSTPRYVWVFEGQPSTLVYGVFDTLESAKDWMRGEGYSGDDTEFQLAFLKMDRPTESSGKGMAKADVPRWSKNTGEPTPRQMSVAIFTDTYNVWDGEVYERDDSEIYNIYRQLPRED
mgnify:CR=1 FL=1